MCVCVVVLYQLNVSIFNPYQQYFYVWSEINVNFRMYNSVSVVLNYHAIAITMDVINNIISVCSTQCRMKGVGVMMVRTVTTVTTGIRVVIPEEGIKSLRTTVERV